LKELVQRAVAEVNPQKIFVFGSRVRGDFHDTSDIDIAFLLDEASSSWARFATNEPERIQTLLNVDLVNLNEAGQDLLDYILDKGVIIYDRTVKI
jgi:CRISPR-associated protein Cmr1